MGKLSGEATVGLLFEVVVGILERLRVREPYLIWGLFAIGLLLIGDTIIRGEWANKIAPPLPRRKRRMLWGCLAVFVFFCFGFWIHSKIRQPEEPSPKEQSISVVPKEHHAQLAITMTEWGSKARGKIYAVVTIEPPPPNNLPFHLLLICRVVDNTLDEIEDTQIETSSLRSVSGQTIEMVVSQRFLERAYEFKTVRVILVILPGVIESGQILNLSDVTRLGGQIAGNSTFTPSINKQVIEKSNAVPYQPVI